MSFEIQRKDMIKYQILSRGIKDKRVLEAMSELPREEFVPEKLRDQAYADNPLPIGMNQTISQPYIVALMTQALELKGKEKVLEIGTGSGYQAAILAKLAHTVYTIDRIEELVEIARLRIERLGMNNVFFRVGDGTLGLREEAPFDRIIVTAAAPHLPDNLIRQMAPGGLMVIPIGSKGIQILKIIKKTKEGIKEENSIACVFVPLIGENGWN
ncbi:MAG: protein-L-isoaspartate(D-aspartate) O-methyltransferase [Spirochaetes bacterium]|nr:protein-L-isoaspartate(D-aspartate) O-methyltransferase [Spirochaetota bacterium]